MKNGSMGRFMSLGAEILGFGPPGRLDWPGMAEMAEKMTKMTKNGEVPGRVAHSQIT